MSQLQQKELIPLDEYSEGIEVTIPFSSEELEILTSEFKGKVEVIFTLTGMKLKATEHVGTIILPNHIVRIKPKISDANFMSMIIYALRLPEIGLGSLPALAHLDFYHIMIRFLINYLEDLLRRGLYKGYITKSENINYVRGKIAFKQHLLHNQSRNDKIFCSFSEITVDTLENRIIKFTLYYLLQYFLIDNSTRLEILGFYKKFHTVGNLKSITRNIFGSITYTPLNDQYRTILSLCELILRDSSLDIEKSGEKSSLSFLVNMETLFQEFIARILTTKFGENNIDLQNTRYFDTNKELTEISDIQLSSGKTSIILDTKYKDIGQAIPPAEHVRQVFCYSRITSSKKCGLIYASGKRVMAKQYHLPDGVCLFGLHFKLSSSSKEEFDQNCTDFIWEINNIIKA